MRMMLESYVRRSRRLLRRVTLSQPVRLALQLTGCFGLGFGLSAASLGNHAQPLCMAVLCAGLWGWLPVAYAAGGAVGYWLFWGNQGLQGILWLAAALPVCLRMERPQAPGRLLLRPSVAALIVAATGVLMQAWKGDDTAIAMYLLRIALAFGGTWLALYVQQKRDTAADWVAMAVCVLALAQIAPLRYCNLGMAVGAMLVGAAPFPAVALAGLALDLARVTPVPMTAVLCVASLLRLQPGLPRGTHYALPAIVYMLVMSLCGSMDLQPLPVLFVGGIVGMCLPKAPQLARHRGEAGVAQAQLELAAQTMDRAEQLLTEQLLDPVDREALIAKAVQRACGSCPCRKNCRESQTAEQLQGEILERPMIHVDDLPIGCKKRGRLLLELRWGQDQLRMLKADRQRQEEYRQAVAQQYRFFADYLQELAMTLPKRTAYEQRFQPEVAVCSRGREMANGDRCMSFAGAGSRYYLLLCDGMGTGTGAAQEAKTAGDMLRRLLVAGYPARYALRSLNSLCTLRDRAGAVTLDLAEIRLDNGKVNVYKWGAAPSWLLLSSGAERIGAFGPPPGLSVTEGRESVDKLSLRKGETLVMVSDGVNAGAICANAQDLLQEPTGSLAASVLELGSQEGADDATAAVVRLIPLHSQQAQA